MEATKLLEMIFGTPWATPEQCEAVAVLQARQEYEREKPRRELLAAYESGNVMTAIWSQVARWVVK